MAWDSRENQIFQTFQLIYKYLRMSTMRETLVDWVFDGELQHDPIFQLPELVMDIYGL